MNIEIHDAEYTIEETATTLATTSRPITIGDQSGRYLQLGSQAKAYAAQSRRKKTIRAYDSDWRHFTRWSEDQGRQALEPDPTLAIELVADYLAHLAHEHYKLTTIERRMSAISQTYQIAGKPSPTQNEIVRSVMKGIRNDPTSNKHDAAKAPAVVADVLAMIRALAAHPNEAIRVRDKALILIGFGGAFRRSELASLQLADLAFSRQGVLITLQESKTSGKNADNEPDRIVIDYGNNRDTCPVRALQAWLKYARIEEADQYVFCNISKAGKPGHNQLGDREIARIVKRQALAAGLNPDDYSGHSLRAGFATSAEQAGISERAGMKHTRHRSERTYRKYVRIANRWSEAPIKKLGL